MIITDNEVNYNTPHNHDFKISYSYIPHTYKHIYF